MPEISPQKATVAYDTGSTCFPGYGGGQTILVALRDVLEVAIYSTPYLSIRTRVLLSCLGRVASSKVRTMNMIQNDFQQLG